MPYTSNDHIHNFAAWAASTAARTSPKCRFKVEIGSAILSESSLPSFINNYREVRGPSSFDERHQELRKEIIDLADGKGLFFTHGIAAKMINIYFKAIYLRPSILEEAEFKELHPPIDRVLLNGLASSVKEKEEMRKWKGHASIGWSNYSSRQYEAVIADVKSFCGDKPLWKVEEFWQGHQ